MTRPNQKKTNMYWFIPSQKKNRAKNSKKKPPWNPETPAIENRSHLDTRVQESYLADANISKPVKYRARYWSCLRHQDGYRRIRLIGNSILELFTEPNGHILKKSQSFQCCGRINISNGSVTASQWPYLYCYRKVRRACITLDGMRLCFYPILSKSWALTKAIVTNRDPGMTKPELNHKPPKKTPTIFWISYFKGIYIHEIYHKEIIDTYKYFIYIYIYMYLS